MDASRFTFPSCSSRAERPPDKRKTAERYRAGRPTHEADGPGANPGFLTNQPHIVIRRFQFAVVTIPCVAAANPRAPIR